MTLLSRLLPVLLVLAADGTLLKVQDVTELTVDRVSSSQRVHAFLRAWAGPA